ncbi:MAG: Glu-tRNA(Gln) amidotransferase subunit GatE [Candidatus Bathyarchaeia archaeon]
MGIDYEALGLRVGLEIHRQLDTAHKLFCDCPTRLSGRGAEVEFARSLRPTQSELGEVDPAALYEFRKGRMALYEADRETSCLVEMDEEPPHSLNREAVEIALAVALRLGSRPVDEIHVMRKVVIDGSNTTGFQRTCAVALGGSLEVGGRTIPIQQICLEEDAARKVGDRGDGPAFAIDRLGIPLIEISTAPAIGSPREARDVAERIGLILKSTGRVKRGIGTIRQDLNISISGGGLVEVKGVQELGLLDKVVEFEALRMAGLMGIRDELRRRGLGPDLLSDGPIDVSDAFRMTASKLVRKALERGGTVLALRLAGFSGLLGRELAPNFRFGTELAHRAVVWGGVGGLFHTDELPGYGISAEEVTEVKRLVGAGDMDAVVLVADERDRAEKALMAVLERAKEAFHGPPSETRAANPDGTTRYMRPRPGSARMYPETDVPPFPISEELLERARASLPPTPEERLKALMEAYGLNEKLARQLLDSEYLSLFEEAVASGAQPTFAATLITETMKALERRGVPIGAIPDSRILELFRAIAEGTTAKESAETLLEAASKEPGKPIDRLISELGLGMMGEGEVRRRIDEILERDPELRRAPFGKLMGIAMSELRGRADAKLVSRILREKIGD